MTFLTLDLTAKKWLLAFLLCLLYWWLFLAPATASASGTPERTYTITETELEGLSIRLQKLAQISRTQKTESKQLQEQLTKLEQELARLKNQLATSNTQLTQAQNSLQNANQLLDQYGKEAKRTRLRIKAQRNAWEAIAACLVIALSVK